MDSRKQVEVIRNLYIYDTSDNEKITREKLMKTIPDIKDNEEVIDLKKLSGFRESGWGMDRDSEPVHFCHCVLVLKSYRLETDDEYFARQKREKEFKHNSEEREKLEYLRLKAKFES